MTGHEHHHHQGKKLRLRAAVITASDTRTELSDDSGRLIRELLEQAGHLITYHAIVPDEPERIRPVVIEQLSQAELIIVSGGTGIAARDATVEALRPLLHKELEGFGELFRMLSYNEIGAAAFLSRALAGIAHGRIVVALPGSPDACRLAMEKLLIPELGHMAHLLKLGHESDHH
ncbi:MAG TPA: molybdenum cofactor biosynthesis protein B [Candidatus Binataceae bacterium]|jgi:molybdenum cofactor biosynthesis protein B|nr:molybdenum cofactor biosynthesis protein B [Candidatus Binataceae bacterium]